MLEYAFKFEYKVQCGDLFENEHDYIFIGYSDKIPTINMEEVAEYKWDSLENINRNRMINPEYYTAWFNIVLDNYLLTIKLKNVK
ncbi:hypothetical protein FACS1894145_2380 [Bacteroidia bacterium]|nr:hypothetical protein FACS1894145_2380 [Bacteroidia bacterium]